MEATLTRGADVAASARRFHVWMAALFVLIAFGGFTPTYWMRLVNGSLHVPAIVHIHGFLLFTWTLFYFCQTAFVASGRVSTHRAWGLAGISLFTLLVCSIIATRITMLKLDDAEGFAEASKRFSAVVFVGLPLLIGLFAAAIANIRKPETHKRLMVLLMANMMVPALARVFLVLLAPAGVGRGVPPPSIVVPPGMVAMLLIGIAMVYDWRTRGRPHQVYVYGGLLSMIQIALVVPIANTQAWLDIATALEHLAG